MELQDTRPTEPPTQVDADGKYRRARCACGRYFRQAVTFSGYCDEKADVVECPRCAESLWF